MDKGPLELLEELLSVTRKMHAAVLSGDLEGLPEYLASRQKLIDALSPLLGGERLQGAERLRALALLGEITQKDEEIRSHLEGMLKQELSSLKEGYKAVQAAKVLRRNIEPPESSRFIEEEG
ncbi:flagellar protein FliT [Candidatus Caldatribacterium sp.]|uniref:flagellar protein FliT n=1 Tax=Candidatus Caldatribacterium sp. TaxID=2282143 RepID=UPI002990A089|nr:flagellar protein FliT [Candidatus Caldatribacterium sp.]MDW8082132.1 flagellar protein FliT [Candidatus Calescibacterium sp.]